MSIGLKRERERKQCEFSFVVQVVFFLDASRKTKSKRTSTRRGGLGGQVLGHQRRDHQGARPFAAHAMGEGGAMAQDMKHQLGDLTPVARAGEAPGAKPVLEKAVGGLGGGAKAFQNIDGRRKAG